MIISFSDGKEGMNKGPTSRFADWLAADRTRRIKYHVGPVSRVGPRLPSYNVSTCDEYTWVLSLNSL